MNLIGTKELETERLLLKVPTMKEQHKLWKILMIPEVNKYYLTINKKFKDRLLSWEKQEPFYKQKVDGALDENRFEWSIFVKETGECIGQINAHNREDLPCDAKDVGWYIDPKYQGNGYGFEAAKAMLDYMFCEVKISKINTGAAVVNPASWKLMEKIGMNRQQETKFNEYTFIDESIECYSYEITREEYLKLSNKK